MTRPSPVTQLSRDTCSVNERDNGGHSRSPAGLAPPGGRERAGDHGRASSTSGAPAPSSLRASVEGQAVSARMGPRGRAPRTRSPASWRREVNQPTWPLADRYVAGYGKRLEVDDG